MESTLRFAAFERRQISYGVVCNIYDSALSIFSSDTKSGPYLSIHYAQFLTKVMDNPVRAREIFEQSLQKFPECKALWQAYIECEFSQMRHDEVDVYNRLQALYTRSVADSSSLSSDEKLEMWKNNLEFAADWCPDIQSYRRLNESFRNNHPHKLDKKRALLSTPEAYAPNKQARTTAVLPTPVAAAAPAAAVPASAGYYPYGQYGYTGYYPQQGSTGYGYPYYPGASSYTPTS